MVRALEITEPTLLLDEARCKANIQRMRDKADRNGVKLRPHFKTHQSRGVGRWFRDMGVDRITVSSLRMACYFAEDGWEDITVAFPVNILEIDRINRLAGKIKLQVLVEDPETVARLDQLLQHPVQAFIKLDHGTHRTGVHPKNTGLINAIISACEASRNITVAGFLSHAGHSYRARSAREIEAIHHAVLAEMQDIFDRYQNRIPNLQIAPGDTPTCSVCDGFGPATEIRPGNFAFYDITQVAIGSCTMQDVAVALACPVVAKHADRLEVILYGGGVHFSKDYLELPNGGRSYGQLVSPEGNGWGAPLDGCYMSKLSQEHGTLQVTAGVFEQLKPGDVVRILPAHSCMTADLMREYVTLDGKRIGCMDRLREYFLY